MIESRVRQLEQSYHVSTAFRINIGCVAFMGKTSLTVLLYDECFLPTFRLLIGDSNRMGDLSLTFISSGNAFRDIRRAMILVIS